MTKHMVVYVGRSSVFTDSRFTEKMRNALLTHEEHGWELISTAARSSPLGDVSGIWLFFKRPAEAEDQAPANAEEQAA
ncbi:MAG: hypothetical protein IIC90_13960 [Chloroflexi bacterium]|nr:hypothetical protein [Chloroflexota bacterium]